MKAKLKHFFFLAFFSLAAMACGGGMAKPTSGLDVSALPRLLSIHPTMSEDKETEQVTEKPEPESETLPEQQPASTVN